ncbi:MIP/aquaporin family protein [Nocardioides sp. GXZ039]|uniref:MIP/aquaporin family protein n=1 Tax=Nocardioides sp. GXZ039 TaxID=3136018 RepID=UPI0030F40D13
MDTTPAPPTTLQKVLAEAIGTFVLVFIGCGSVVLSVGKAGSLASEDAFTSVDLSDLASIATIGLSFGLAVTVMVYAVGRISGGHFNPAVTVGAVIGGRMAWKEAPIYIGAQLVGAIVAGAGLLIVAMGFDGFDAFDSTLGTNGWGDDGTGYAVWAALILEMLLTAIFVFVILGVTDERNEHPALAPLAIGLTLAIIHFVAIPATGTSVNPARSIGPALFSGSDPLIQVWVFIIAPIVGALIAGIVYPAIFGHATEPVPGSGFNFGGGAPAAPGYGAPDQFQQQWNQPGATPAFGGHDAGHDHGHGGPGGQGGYAQPGQQTGQHAGQAEQPIIQDGWQWDPQAQQWIPAQQQPPAQTSWPSPGEQTQVRPPDGS